MKHFAKSINNNEKQEIPTCPFASARFNEWKEYTIKVVVRTPNIKRVIEEIKDSYDVSYIKIEQGDIMPNRTRRESLERCRKLWLYIAENNGDKISAYMNIGFVKRDNSDCPACEYRESHTRKIYCYEYCIISWPLDTCMSYKSPFVLWDLAKRYDNKQNQKKYAMRIVKLCDEALAKLPPLKTK